MSGVGIKRKTPNETSSGDDTHIPFVIVGPDGRRLYFKLNRDTPFQKVFTDYCNRMNVDYEVMRFLYNGQRVQPKATPRRIKIKRDDEITAAREVMGGGSCST